MAPLINIMLWEYLYIIIFIYQIKKNNHWISLKVFVFIEKKNKYINWNLFVKSLDVLYSFILEQLFLVPKVGTNQHQPHFHTQSQSVIINTAVDGNVFVPKFCFVFLHFNV